MTSPDLLVAVVDDEEPIRRAFSRLLRAAGLKVETFGTGAEFLQSLVHHRPDCLVLDLNMPTLDGFAVQACLNERNIPLPTVIVSGQDAPATREQVLKSGASVFLRKPVDDQALLTAIHEAVEEHR